MSKTAHAKVRRKPSKISTRRRANGKTDAVVEAKPRPMPTPPTKPVDEGLNRDTPSLLNEAPGERITDAVERGPASRRRDEPVEWLDRNSDTEGPVE
jgi:hypothetical protein